ncbi:MAG TPA: adenylate/guanylate cyclase domain-containing protein, partial [Actinomycetaceae bacterium]|nr:adenylate/guanylate cyclase domain-containing protein [Actinomycetaceae bacterium]
RDLAERAGVSLGDARAFWRAMGFRDVGDDDIIFTDSDVAALGHVSHLVTSERMSRATVTSLVRAQSYMADRLVVWQVEALVEDIARRHDLDDTSARIVLLDRMAEIAEDLEVNLVYTWRRQLAALAGRLDSEIARRPVEEPDPESLPLPRALGYIDMVSFTATAAELGPDALAALVQGFEFTARDVITSHGARVVKTIGDAVLYVADDLQTGAAVAIALLETMEARRELLPVRGSLVWGRIVSRSGDVFGPVVNLASRLVDVAEPGTVVIDEATAKRLSASPVGNRYVQRPRPAAMMQGIGSVVPIELHRAPDAPPA